MNPILTASIILGTFAGAALVFAAMEGRIRDLISAAFLAALLAVILALSLCLMGCGSAGGEYYDIPVDFGSYQSTVAPLSGCDGR